MNRRAWVARAGLVAAVLAFTVMALVPIAAASSAGSPSASPAAGAAAAPEGTPIVLGTIPDPKGGNTNWTGDTVRVNFDPNGADVGPDGKPLPSGGLDLEATKLFINGSEQKLSAPPSVVFLAPSNPTLQVADIPRLAKMARAHDVLVVVDNTFTPPPLFIPLQHGADVSLHSTTKFMGGHGDTVGGIVVSSEDILESIVQSGRVYGGVMSPFNAWLTLRGIRTLPLRLERSTENAATTTKLTASGVLQHVAPTIASPRPMSPT